MIPAGQWRLDDARAAQLKPIAEKLKLEFPQLMDRAIDEFIAKHQVPAKPQPPKESEKDKYHRQRIAELSRDMELSTEQIQRDIMEMPVDNLHRKYAIRPDARRGFQEYVKRTSRGVRQ